MKHDRYLHWLGYLEGTSLLLLLFAAMPYRHFTGDHSPVRAMGTAHGFLFVLYAVALLGTSRERDWGLKTVGIGLVLASLPFGAFYFDRKFLDPFSRSFKGNS